MSIPPLTLEVVKPALFDLLERRRAEDGPKPTAAGTSLRGSQAGQCSRRVGFDLLDVEEDYPPDGAALAAFAVGDAWHEVIQQAMAERHSMDVEVPVDLRPYWDVSGSADGVYRTDLGTVVVEIKSISSFGFSLVSTGLPPRPKKSDQRAPTGPKREHLLQAGIYALGLEADAVHFVYVNKDKLGEMCEFVVNLDQRLPDYDSDYRTLVVGELDRLAADREMVADGTLPPRWAPEFGAIQQPPPHHTEGGKGDPWLCRYCPYNAKCVQLPPGAVAVSEIPA